MANDTMQIGSVIYNVWYVDPTLSSNGDGLSPATAFNVFPSLVANIPEGALYLIRRTAASVAVVQPGGTGTTNNLIYMGMPLPTDDLYAWLPAAAVSAWGADSTSIPYANLKMTSDTSYVRSANYNFLAFRIYFFRASGIGCSNMFLNFSNDMRLYSNITFDTCKFGSYDFDLSTPGFNTVITNNLMSQYWTCGYARSATVRNCIINYGPCDNTRWGIIGTAMYWTIQDSVVNMTGSCENNYVFNTQPNNIRSYLPGTEEFVLENVQVNFWVNGSGSYSDRLPQFLTNNWTVRTVVHNLTYNEIGILGGSTTSTPTMHAGFMNLDYLQSFHIQHITLNVAISAQLYYAESGNAVNNLNGSYSGNWRPSWLVFGGMESFTYSDSHERILDDINVLIADAPAIGGYSRSTGELQSNAGYGCAVYLGFNQGGNWIYDQQQGPQWKPVKATNLTINNYTGRALCAVGVQIDGLVARGQVVINHCLADITSIDIAHPGYALWPQNYSIIKCGPININKNSPQGIYVAQPVVYFGSDTSEAAQVFVSSCNVPLHSNATNTNGNVGNRWSLVCPNDGAEGNFTIRTWNCLVTTCGTVRSGGGAASLRFVNNSYDSSNPTQNVLFFAKDPNTGLLVTPVTTGLQYLCIYVAHKNYSDPVAIQHKFRAIVKVPTTQNAGHRWYNSYHQGQWLADTVSEWTGDTGLTALVCKIPINVAVANVPIEVKFRFSWYSATGYLIVDPTLVLSNS